MNPDAEPTPKKTGGTFFSGISVFWPLKLVLSLAIILSACVAVFQTDVPTVRWLCAVGLILTGACTELAHYRILKKTVGPLGKPEKLNTTGGLFSFVRHPMYLGDLVMLFGFTLLAATALIAGLYLAFLPVLILLCRSEDRMMEAQFRDDFRAWKKRSAMLIPFLL